LPPPDGIVAGIWDIRPAPGTPLMDASVLLIVLACVSWAEILESQKVIIRERGWRVHWKRIDIGTVHAKILQSLLKMGTENFRLTAAADNVLKR